MLLLIDLGRYGEALSEALGVVASPTGIALVVGGTLLGITVGSIPGLGGPVALSLLIPITFEMDAQFAFIILAATLGGVNMGGSITAILLNTPGTAPNAATTFDGFPMAQQGRAPRRSPPARSRRAPGRWSGSHCSRRCCRC